MPGSLDQIININISQQTAAVAQESFSIPLIIGPTVPTSGGIVNEYFAPSGMLTNGYTISSPEYIYALEMFEQALTPTEFLVGQRTTAVAQVDHLIVNSLSGIPGHIYKFTLNNTWYGMCLTQGTDADVLQAASLIESLKKIYLAISDTAAIPTTSSTDIASVLMGKSLKRTALMYTNTSYINEGKDSAWLGGQLPAVPGSNNWAFKTLVGCTPDNLTATQQGILIGNPVSGVAGKNVNIYQTVGGQNITQMGTMAGGQFIDITIGIDWLESTLQTNIFVALVQAAKIPYTDKGTGILISAVKAAIDQGVVNGLIDGASPITITAASVLSVPSNQRATRVSPTISFSCRLAGAFNAVVVQGTVTV
jgi:Protein of unknown function (DUF3383)